MSSCAKAIPGLAGVDVTGTPIGVIGRMDMLRGSPAHRGLSARAAGALSRR